MFSSPVRTVDESGNVKFQVQVAMDPMGLRIECGSDHTFVGNNVIQSQFRNLQKFVLSELTKEKSLFKHQPSLDSLELLTPNWGFVVLHNTLEWSPYCYKTSSITADQRPCWVDLKLTAIEITRSSIRPVFETLFLEKLQIAAKDVIDFEWSGHAGGGETDVEEVSDIPDIEDTHSLVRLIDPEKKERDKKAAKEAVRAALATAEQARVQAATMADEFLQNYDLSDTESAFTEWMSESED